MRKALGQSLLITASVLVGLLIGSAMQPTPRVIYVPPPREPLPPLVQMEGETAEEFASRVWDAPIQTGLPPDAIGVVE